MRWFDNSPGWKLTMPTNRPGAQENLVLFLALIPYVMDRGEVSVTEAAETFGRHPDDITKAVELIACSGIPGDTSAYLHADLFDIDWDLFIDQGIIRFENTIVIDSQPGFSAREMSALIAGLQYLAQHPSWAGRTDVQELLQKLSATTPTLMVKSSPPTDTIDVLTSAIDQGTQVVMVYVNKRGERITRTVDPIAVDSRDEVWFFRAWCHTRQALRTFRVDRIETIQVTTTPASSHDDVLSPEQWSVFSPSEGDVVATIEFSPQALPLVAEYVDRHSTPEKIGDVFVARIPFAHLGSLTRFVSKHPGLVTVVSPPEARQQIQAWAHKALANYR
jgi:proteasome accessory factor C